MDDVVFVQVRDRAGERRRPRKTYNDLETRCDALIENLRALEIAPVVRAHRRHQHHRRPESRPLTELYVHVPTPVH